MYTEERTTNNETLSLAAADPNAGQNLAFSEASRLIKPTLLRGSTGQAVKELQQLLFHWQYYFGLIDGIFGVYVESAVKEYQHRVFLPEDGIVGSLTWQTLYSGAPIKPILMIGSSGNDVRIVQDVLLFNGYYFGFIDRFFGPMTKVAVIQFQTNKALPADGIVGSRTWHALSKLPH